MTARWLEKTVLSQWFPSTETGPIIRANAATGLRANWLSQRRKTELQLDRLQTPPVIVVGNLVAGGGGKTPTVIALGKSLSNVAFLCKGYGARIRKPRRVKEFDNPDDHGDEAVLIAKQNLGPVFAGDDRLATLKLCLSQSKPDWIISDDGLQHFAMPRAIQIACIDQRGFGNGKLLPFGPLREPLASLTSFDAILLDEQFDGLQIDNVRLPLTIRTRTEFESIQRFSPQLPSSDQQFLENRTDRPNQLFKPKQPVVLLAGIANPNAFFKSFARQFPDTQVSRTISLRDHASVTDSLANQLLHETVVMTEKDEVKWSWWLANQHTDASKQAPDWWTYKIARHFEKDVVTLLKKVLR